MMDDGKGSILLVDDDPGMQYALLESLRRSGYRVTTASDGEEGVEQFLSGSFEMVITDVKMKRMDGIRFLKEVKRHAPGVPVLVVTAYGTIDNAIEAMKLGACDYLLKPFSLEALQAAVERGLSPVGEAVWPAPSPRAARAPESEKRGSGLSGPSAGRGGVGGRPEGTPHGPPNPEGEREMITREPQMIRLLKMAENVAASQATVLIQGESGTGKELLARFIHHRSSRKDRPFVAINCAAIADGLLESELFGHERGAFTGAVRKKMGKFAAADQGTLLLDEIGEMGLPLQAKLLRVLQERVVDTVGGDEPVRVDIRVIATTHRNLRKEVEAGRFREDLYYRLNVFPITLPSLRERKGDIPLLVRHFLEKLQVSGRLGNGPVPGCLISEEAESLLISHDWKGNIRELENVIERAILLSEGRGILPEYLILEGGGRSSDWGLDPIAAEGSGASMREMERALIFKTLGEVQGNRTRAAKVLGIGLRTLRNKLRDYREEGVPIP